MGRGGGGGYGGVSHASNFGSIACSRFFTLCTSNVLDQMGFSQMYNIHMLNCKINGTVHIFFLKKSYLSPRCPKLPNFFF